LGNIKQGCDFNLVRGEIIGRNNKNVNFGHFGSRIGSIWSLMMEARRKEDFKTQIEVII
jgi:hypothetical protein